MPAGLEYGRLYPDQFGLGVPGHAFVGLVHRHDPVVAIGDDHPFGTAGQHLRSQMQIQLGLPDIGKVSRDSPDREDPTTGVAQRKSGGGDHLGVAIVLPHFLQHNLAACANHLRLEVVGLDHFWQREPVVAGVSQHLLHRASKLSQHGSVCQQARPLRVEGVHRQGGTVEHGLEEHSDPIGLQLGGAVLEQHQQPICVNPFGVQHGEEQLHRDSTRRPTWQYMQIG